MGSRSPLEGLLFLLFIFLFLGTRPVRKTGVQTTRDDAHRNERGKGGMTPTHIPTFLLRWNRSRNEPSLVKTLVGFWVGFAGFEDGVGWAPCKLLEVLVAWSRCWTWNGCDCRMRPSAQNSPQRRAVGGAAHGFISDSAYRGLVRPGWWMPGRALGC